MDKETLLKTLENVRQAIDPENEFTVDLKSNKKRSLNANAYMWVLCEKIAQKTSQPKAPITKEDVYRENIRLVGVWDDMAIIPQAVQRFISGWESKGVGWFCEKFGESKVKGAEKIRVYYGSSSYEQPEMSRLVDLVVVTAQDLGIETMTPDEIERMKQNWRV